MVELLTHHESPQEISGDLGGLAHGVAEPHGGCCGLQLRSGLRWQKKIWHEKYGDIGGKQNARLWCHIDSKDARLWFTHGFQ